MAQINVAPVVFKNYGLKIATDNYEKHVNEVTLTATTPTAVFKGATAGQVQTDAGTTEWELTLGYAQDWATTNSLSLYLLNNNGAKKTIEFFPLATGTGPKFAGTVLVVPGNVGGKVDEMGMATVTLKFDNQPTFTAGA